MSYLREVEAVSNDLYLDEKWIPLYEKVLADFLEDPASKKNLP